jgi:hypothetical protein
MLRFADPNTVHEIDVNGTKVYLKSISIGERLAGLSDLQKLIEIKDGKLVNAGLLAAMIDHFEGRDKESVEANIQSLETAKDLLDLVSAITRFATLGEVEAKNSETLLSGKPAEGILSGSSRPTLSEADVAADLNALADKG